MWVRALARMFITDQGSLLNVRAEARTHMLVAALAAPGYPKPNTGCLFLFL
jgi:hypothetical protein